MIPPKLSIVTAYHNRKESFLKTLDSFTKSKYANEIEVIVTDDGSDEGQRLGYDFIPEGYPFHVRVVIVDKDKKTWKNPCIAFNLAILQADGEKIILQNPENYHVTDIIAHTIDNLTKEDYFVYKVFAMTLEQSKDIENTIKTVEFEKISTSGRENGWYIHPIHRNGYYHFVSAIDTEILKKDLGGFDERFAHGWGFDDDELFIRIQRRKLRAQIINDHLALHQWHPPSIPFEPTNEGLKNGTLYSTIINPNKENSRYYNGD